jgi:hypothetical protein
MRQMAEAPVTREGGCLCGAVRYRASGNPSRTVVCHCKFCQRCTGSAFAVWPTFGQEKVEIRGTLTGYKHHWDESGRWIRLNFCQVWTRSKQHWVSLPAGVAAFEKSSSG